MKQILLATAVFMTATTAQSGSSGYMDGEDTEALLACAMKFTPDPARGHVLAQMTFAYMENCKAEMERVAGGPRGPERAAEAGEKIANLLEYKAIQLGER